MSSAQSKSVASNCPQCGLPLTDNPHPDAGKFPQYLEVGCPKECIPCLTLSRHQWAGRAMRAEKALRDMEQALQAAASGEALAWGILLTDKTFHGDNFGKILFSDADKARVETHGRVHVRKDTYAVVPLALLADTGLPKE